MFVEMDKDDNFSVCDCDALINRARDDEDGFTPDEAIAVLKKTNHYANIKKVIKVINDFKTAEERLAFKEFVLSAVDGREVTLEVFDALYKLAVEGGYGTEFLRVITHTKVYKIKDCNMLSKQVFVDENTTNSDADIRGYDRVVFDYIYYKNGKGRQVPVLDDLPIISIFRNAESICFSDRAIDKVEDLVFENIKNVHLSNVYNRNLQSIDVQCCKYVSFKRMSLKYCGPIKFGAGAKVFFEDVYSMPKEMDLSLASKIDMIRCDLSNWDNWNRKGGESINLSGSKNFPKVLYLSGFDEVNLDDCDFSGVEEIRFKGGKSIDLSKSKNFPKVLDLSGFDEVCLKDCDLTGVEEFKFKDGAKVNLANAKFDISKVDFSKFSDVVFSNVDFSVFSELKFREDAFVSISNARGFPKVVDLSNVREAIITCCDFAGVEELKIKSKNKASLYEISNLSCNLDLSLCDDVIISHCNLSKLKDIKFGKKGRVYLSAVILPEVVDLSEVDEVQFDNSNLAKVKEIKFKEGGKAEFRFNKGFPEDFSILQLDEVYFYECDLSKVKNLEAREGCKLYMKCTELYPKVLDVSKCSDLSMNLSKAGLEKMHRVIFKNRTQRDKADVEDYILRIWRRGESTLKYRLMRLAKFRYVEERRKEGIEKRKQQQMNNGAER